MSVDMSSDTASAANVSRTSLKPENVTRSHASGVSQGQCTPRPLPEVGKQTIIRGNGTNLDTVISLECPASHKVVGRALVCALGTNSTQWVGDIYCKPMSAFWDFGFRVAVAASVVSSAIILLLSMAFITCCVRKIQESARERAMLKQQRQIGQHSSQRYSHKGRNNNNNNNNNNNTQEKAVSLWVDHNPALRDNSKACRCQSYDGGAMGPLSPITLVPLPGHDCDQPLLLPHSLHTDHAGLPQHSAAVKHHSTARTHYPAPSRTSAYAQSSGPGLGCPPVGHISGNSWNDPAMDKSNGKNTNSARECSIRTISL